MQYGFPKFLNLKNCETSVKNSRFWHLAFLINIAVIVGAMDDLEFINHLTRNLHGILVSEGLPLLFRSLTFSLILHTQWCKWWCRPDEYADFSFVLSAPRLLDGITCWHILGWRIFPRIYLLIRKTFCLRSVLFTHTCTVNVIIDTWRKSVASPRNGLAKLKTSQWRAEIMYYMCRPLSSHYLPKWHVLWHCHLTFDPVDISADVRHHLDRQSLRTHRSLGSPCYARLSNLPWSGSSWLQ